MAKDQNADRFVTKRWPYNDQSIRYVRSATGNDDNDGLTPATAWQTLEKGLESFAIAAPNKIWTLDLAGTFTGANTLNIGGTQLAGQDSDLDAAATGPDNFFSRALCQFRASPVPVVTPIGITGGSAQATTGLRIVNVSNVLVPGAHVGQMLLGSGLAEYARIIANTANTITISTTTDPSGWTAPVAIYTEGATITYGDAANFFEEASYFIGLADWAFTGIAFKSTASSKVTALSVIALADVYFLQCSFEGLYLRGGPSYVRLDCCDVYGNGATQDYGHDGSGIIARQSTFRDVDFRCHGSADTGNNTYIQCGFLNGTLPFGGGNVESRFSFGLNQCYFDGFTNDAIHVLFGNSRIQNTLIENTTGDAIQVENSGTRLTLDNVDGSTGNTGVGVRILNGAQVDVNASTSVTGAGGDIVLGDAGVIAYAAVPAVDLGQLVRVY